MLRKVIIILLSLGILAGGYFGFKSLSKKPDSNREAPPPAIKGVYAKTVTNSDIPLRILSSGQLLATRNVQLTAEVTGVLESSRFNEGVEYRKGQTVFTINNAETESAVVSLRSTFYSKLLLVMPDLKLDYPDVWAKWDNYLKSIDINKSLPALPEFSGERERNFITANGIITSFQNVKNSEIRSGKFVLRAPFSGVVTTANVEEGSLVAMGQPLGQFSSLGDYELELPVNISYLPYLKVGREIELRPLEGVGTYQGKVVRINPRADVNSQSIIAYVRVISPELREGMYLQAEIDAGFIENAIEIDRKLINSELEIYTIVQDTILSKVTVEPVYFKESTAIVKGIPDSTVIIGRSLPAAYPGMQVRILEDLSKRKQPVL